MAKKKGSDKKGKRPHKNKPTGKKHSHYIIEGEKTTKGKTCPRCGPGVFLAKHNGRVYCGRCHYTEFEGKSSESSVSQQTKK